jgi:hypothetical protein
VLGLMMVSLLPAVMMNMMMTAGQRATIAT